MVVSHLWEGERGHCCWCRIYGKRWIVDSVGHGMCKACIKRMVNEPSNPDGRPPHPDGRDRTKMFLDRIFRTKGDFPSFASEAIAKFLRGPYDPGWLRELTGFREMARYVPASDRNPPVWYYSTPAPHGYVTSPLVEWLPTTGAAAIESRWHESWWHDSWNHDHHSSTFDSRRRNGSSAIIMGP